MLTNTTIIKYKKKQSISIKTSQTHHCSLATLRCDSFNSFTNKDNIHIQMCMINLDFSIWILLINWGKQFKYRRMSNKKQNVYVVRHLIHSHMICDSQ